MIDLKNKNILLVEDFPFVRESIRAMLQMLEATEITEMANGFNAIEALERRPYDIVLCDYNLGKGKNGQQVLEEVRAKNLLSYDAVFIMITAEQVQSMVLSVIENKPDEYLTKPFSAHQLAVRIQRATNKKEFFKQIEACRKQEQYQESLDLCNQELAKETVKMRSALLKMQAELTVALHDYTQAEALYLKIIEERELAWAIEGLAQVYILQKKYQKASNLLLTLIEKAPISMGAYDLLSQVYQATGQDTKAKEILKKATLLSPLTLVRQRKLVDIATKTGDLVIAEVAGESVLELGKHSVHRDINDFSKLANVFIRANKANRVPALIKEMQTDFSEHTDELLLASIVESGIYKQLGHKDKASAAFDNALNLNQKHKPDKNLQLEMLKSCFIHNKEKGKELLEQLVKSHVDDEVFLKKIIFITQTLGLQNHANLLIKQSKKALIDINNQGVKLYKEKKYTESIAIFTQAVTSMHGNKTILYNLLEIMFHEVKVTGSTPDKLQAIKNYLDKAEKLDFATDKLQPLQHEYLKLIRG